MKLEVCKDCPYNDGFYGCVDQDCEVYVDIKSEYEYKIRREMEADEDLERRKDIRLGL